MLRSFTKPGYLLIELIAAIVISAVLAAALLPGLAARTEGLAEAELFDRVCDFDRRVRLLSYREGPIRVHLEGNGGLLARGGFDREALMRMDLGPGGVHLVDTETSREIASFVVDRLGRTDGYTVVIRRAGTVFAVEIDGLTGRAAAVRAAGGGG